MLGASGSGGGGSSGISASGGFSSGGTGGSSGGGAGIEGATDAVASSSSANESSTLERSRVARVVGPGAYFIYAASPAASTQCSPIETAIAAENLIPRSPLHAPRSPGSSPFRLPPP